jgi:hypothetical protein
MTEQTRALSASNLELAGEVAAVRNFDPGLGAYAFGDLGQAVQFASLMAKAGEMLPPHLRMKPALCLAVTMRAIHWGFDPFALAQETYQAKEGGVIGYQAKVFVAALRSTGVTLRFEFGGEIVFDREPARSARGNQVAPHTATGTRRCTAWAMLDGERLAYTTLELAQISPKNSPLWHIDPDQQLAYFAGRGWTRRYRPDVIMGAYSSDEVEEMRAMRDVTPRASGFAALAERARAEAADPGQQPVNEASGLGADEAELERAMEEARRAADEAAERAVMEAAQQDAQPSADEAGV